MFAISETLAGGPCSGRGLLALLVSWWRCTPYRECATKQGRGRSMGEEGEDHPQAFRLTLLATSKAMVLGYVLEAEWVYSSGHY